MKLTGAQPNASDDQILSSVELLVALYSSILGADVPPPRLRIEESPAKSWGGLCEWAHGEHTTTIHVHRKVLGDFRTLRRIVAHETIHHVLDLTGRAGRGHGADFRVGMAKINAVEGEGYVTLSCGADHVMGGQSRRPYWLVVKPHPVAPDRWLYAWALRPSPRVRAAAKSQGARLAQVSDHKWAARGARAGRRWSVARDEDAAELRQLFLAAGSL